MTELKEFNLSNEAHIIDGIIGNFTFEFRNEIEFEKIKDRLNERYYSEDKVKEAIKILKEWGENRRKDNTIYTRSSDELNDDWLEKIDEVFGDYLK